MVMVSGKRCSKCGLSKAAEEFYKDSSSATGLDSCCRECRRQYARNRPKRETPAVAEKMCSHCNQVKPASDFGKNARETTGLQPWCRACHSTYVNRKPKVDAPCVSEKRCSKCAVVKPANDFCKDKYKPSGLRSWCRGCRNRARAATRQERPCVKSQKCRGCGGIKPAHLFPRCKENTSGLKSTCYKCVNDRSTSFLGPKRRRGQDSAHNSGKRLRSGCPMDAECCVLKNLTQPPQLTVPVTVNLPSVIASPLESCHEGKKASSLAYETQQKSKVVKVGAESDVVPKLASTEEVGFGSLGVREVSSEEYNVCTRRTTRDTLMARYVDRSGGFPKGFACDERNIKAHMAGGKMENLTRITGASLEGLYMLVRAAETVSAGAFQQTEENPLGITSASSL